MKNKILVFGSYLLVLLLLSGCASTSRGRTCNSETSVGPSIGIANILQFEDVPIPAGFKIIERESFAFQNDVSRVALLKYSGGRNVDQVVWFFKEQMPLYNWNPINIIEYERKILNYDKDTETCIITVESQLRGSVVTIAISPKSRPMKVKAKAENP